MTTLGFASVRRAGLVPIVKNKSNVRQLVMIFVPLAMVMPNSKMVHVSHNANLITNGLGHIVTFVNSIVIPGSHSAIVVVVGAHRVRLVTVANVPRSVVPLPFPNPTMSLRLLNKIG